MMIGRMANTETLRAVARRFFVFLGLAVCVGTTAQARVVTVTVISTTDMHGSIRRTPGVYVDHNEGSLLQCATLIRGIREENPNSLLVDCGDFAQGTAESYMTRGDLMVRAMNALEYDAVAIGNHEFDWGVPALGGMLSAMKVPPLAANMLAGPETPPAFQRVLPFVVKEVDGLTVAIVGLTTPNIPNWSRDVEPSGLRITDSRRALELTLPMVRERRPHIMILLAHQGLMAGDDDANEINGVCRRFGEFDLVLGGHLHWVLPGARVGKADYAQAGSGASGVMRTDLVFDTVENAVVEKRFEYVPVLPETPEDPELAALVAPDLKKADKWLDTVLGKTTEELSYSLAGNGFCPVQQLLCKAIAEKTGAEVVLHGVLSDNSIPAGKIHVSDIWRIVPYENTVGTLWLTLAEIRAILEESMEYFGSDRYFGAFGLQYEVYPNARAGKRIRNLRAADGSAINGKRRMKVAMNSYQLAGGGGRFPALVKTVGSTNARLELLDVTTRDMVMEYVKAHRTLTIPAGTNAVVIRSEPPRWQRRR